MITTKDFREIKEQLYSAVISDALDALGYRNQSPQLPLRAFTGIDKMIGRSRTTLWADLFHDDPAPYELELRAVDSCEPGDIFVAAASGSMRSGIWGELLTTAAMNRGCDGALIDGAVRDIAKIKTIGFPVFAIGRSVYDSLHRQRVIDIDVPVEIGGVVFAPGDLIFADEDGVVVVPQRVEARAIDNAFKKVRAENTTRDEIRKGMKAAEAYKKYGVL